jgi:hypothetical protein
MTESDVVRIIRSHLEGQFPKDCPNCKWRFATFRDFLLVTKPLGPTISYDAELGDWNPADPAETVTFANCQCGNTLVLTSAGMPLLRLWSLMNWARVETKKRKQTLKDLLNHLRNEINQQVLSGS